jgi:hypothetical protein
VAGVDELVERSGELKREVLAFAMGPAFKRELRKQLTVRFGNPAIIDQKQDLENFFDWFIQQYRRPDGRTIVDGFLDTRPDLPDADRMFLLGWRDVVEGVFEITGRDGPALVAVNVIDDLEYRIRTNVGPSIFRGMPRRSFLIARVVPVGTQWLLSGVSARFPASERARLMQIAASMAMKHPELVYRNPHLLARSWEIQRAERRAFIEHFGSDTIVMDTTELPERMGPYFASRRAAPSFAEQFITTALSKLKSSTQTVGLIYDEADGLIVCGDYQLLEEAFAEPARIRDRRYRRVVRGYLTDDSLGPVPLVRLAEQDHGKASQVFQRVTNNATFCWPQDGEPLLRRHKPSWYARPQLPRIVVLNDRLSPHLAVS